MNILAVNDTKSTSDFTTRERVVSAIVKLKRSYRKACSYYHTSRTSARRWVKAYSKTHSLESLKLKSHKPLSEHPRKCDESSISLVLNKHKRCPDKTPFETWLELRSDEKYNFQYCFMTVLRIFQRNGFYKKYTTNKKKKHDGIYKTPKYAGEKRQVDVKYVPKECNSDKIKDTRFYQYTVLDEASRKRYLYYTDEHSMYETVKAIKGAITYFGYIPLEIQTDNGFEFSDKARRNPDSKTSRKYDNLLEYFLREKHIKHHFIRPRTPEHNGKVERSHRIDQEKFYRTLKFYNLGDLRKQGLVWMRKYNSCPRFCLNFKSPNEVELETLKELFNNTGEVRGKCFTSFVS